MGGSTCAIVTCHAKKSKNRGLCFPRVPPKGTNDEWRNKLLHIINRCDKDFNPDTAFICSRHFEDSCFTVALTVRFLTRRFIGDYDPHLEKVYTCTRCVDGDTIVFEVLDTAAQQDEKSVEESIRWADAYILLYSIADRCSLNECLRLKFLVNAYGKRNRKYSVASPEAALSSNPVALVGNQNDRSLDRMVPLQEGVACAAQLGCVAFYEISVRECCDSVPTIFEDLYICHKRPKKFRAIYPRRSVSECRFPPPGKDEKCKGSGVYQEIQVTKEGRGGRRTCEDTADSSAKPAAEGKEKSESPVGRRRGALQSIS